MIKLNYTIHFVTFQSVNSFYLCVTSILLHYIVLFLLTYNYRIVNNLSIIPIYLCQPVKLTYPKRCFSRIVLGQWRVLSPYLPCLVSVFRLVCRFPFILLCLVVSFSSAFSSPGFLSYLFRDNKKREGIRLPFFKQNLWQQLRTLRSLPFPRQLWPARQIRHTESACRQHRSHQRRSRLPAGRSAYSTR